MSKKLAIAMFGQKRLSREGGVEIVVKELCTRMAQNGCDVTCYNRAATEKKKILEEEFGVAMNEELEREVLVMCNLSQGVKAEGREEGINIGEMRMLVKQVRKGRVTIEEAAEDAGMTVEEFKKVMENTPLQAV